MSKPMIVAGPGAAKADPRMRRAKRIDRDRGSEPDTRPAVSLPRPGFERPDTLLDGIVLLP